MTDEVDMIVRYPLFHKKLNALKAQDGKSGPEFRSDASLAYTLQMGPLSAAKGVQSNVQRKVG